MESEPDLKSAADLERYARQRFAFLEREHGLVRRKEVGGSPVTVLAYLGRDLGFEIQLEWREALVDLLVVRLRDGALPPPTAYYMHEGRRVRRRLPEVLGESFPEQRRRLRELDKVTGPDRLGRMKAQIDCYAEVLEAVAGDVLRRGGKAFDEAPGA